MSDIALEQEALPLPDTAPPEGVANIVENTPNLDEPNRAVLPVDREKTAVERFLDEPAVRRAAPAVVGLLVLLFCIFFYMWVSAPGYRAVFAAVLSRRRASVGRQRGGGTGAARVRSRSAG